MDDDTGYNNTRDSGRDGDLEIKTIMHGGNDISMSSKIKTVMSQPNFRNKLIEMHYSNVKNAFGAEEEDPLRSMRDVMYYPQEPPYIPINLNSMYS